MLRKGKQFQLTSGTRRVKSSYKLVISHEWGNDREVLRQVEHTIGSVASLLAATLYQRNPDWDNKL